MKKKYDNSDTQVFFPAIEKAVETTYQQLSPADKKKLQSAEFEFLPQERKLGGRVVSTGIRGIRYRDRRDGSGKRDIPLVNFVPPYSGTDEMFNDILTNADVNYNADVNAALRF